MFDEAVAKPPTILTAMEKGLEHLQTLYRVSQLLRQAEADSLQIDLILPRILHIAAETVNARTGSIIIIDTERQAEHGWMVDGENSYQTSYMPFWSEVISAGIAGQAMRGKETIVINNTLEDSRWLHRPNHATAISAWSALCTPIISREHAIGAITITKMGDHQFDSADIALLETISGQSAIIISNANLLALTQRQLREAELFNDISKAINASLDINDILHTMLRQMNELLKVEATSVALAEGNELHYTIANGIGSAEIIGLRLPSNFGISGWVMEYSQPTIVNDPANDPRFGHVGDERTGTQTRAMICAPLQVQGRVLGTIQAINPVNDFFTGEDLRVLVRLANLASSALGNAEQFKAIQAAEARYSNLFEDSIDPIVITSLNGYIREVNQRALVMLGYNRHQLLGESINMLHEQPIYSHAQELLKDNTGKIVLVKTPAVTQEGDTIPIEVYIKRIKGPTIDELQWIYHDISQQEQLEQMRNDLTAMLFHDLQNPLSNVISSLELLEMELPPDFDPMLKVMTQIAYRSSQRLRHLVRSLLDVNQLEAGAPVREKDETIIHDMFQYTLEMTEASLERRQIQLVEEIAPNLPTAYVNRDMIERVLINLVDNALKFSKNKDTITLAAQPHADKKFILIKVIDQGPGIPAKFRRQIFDKFYRAPNNTSKGIGLGLAFCRLAVEAHEGQIWATQAPGGGAQINFTVPCHQSKK